MPRKSSQTETEIDLDQQLNPDPAEAIAPDDALLQTETESTENDAADPADTPEGAEDSPISQTETEIASDEEMTAGLPAEGPPDAPVPQTETENTADEEATTGPLAEESRNSSVSQTDSETEGIPEPGALNSSPELPAPQTETDKPEKTASSAGSRRRRAGKADISSQSGAEPDPGGKIPEPARSDSGTTEPRSNTTRQSRPARRQRRGEPIVSIDAERTVQTDADKLRNDILDLVESLKTRKILTGTIQGVERSDDNPNISFAVIYHGEFKIIIPADETVKPPEDFRDRLPGDVMHYLVTKRLGAEVDYIVKGIDQKTGIAAASRLDAMASKRREYYFGSDRDGNNLLYEGISAEARVVSVIRTGIFVDIFGLEVYIPLRELSYQRWMDAGIHFQSGQRVLVKILSIDRSDRNDLRVAASVKQASENPYEKALRRYSVGSRYVGTVSMVDTKGVFVSLDGGIDCLCSHPKRGRPPRGARVTVRILGINHDSNRIWGAITHMTNR
jgi:predicted RNA-binding protein with RPS1 domain